MLMMRNLLALACGCGVALAIGAMTQPTEFAWAADGPSAETVIQGWKPMPRQVAQKMIAKYGQPSEVAAQRLIWHGNGPWKRTELVNEEIAHDFPMPHKDMLKQVINYRIDSDDADELAEYDGSVILERTKGELAARCDKEEANFLAINLAHDISNGKRDVGDARRFYAESIAALMKGKPNEYVQGFRFTVARGDQGDRDKPFGPVGTSGR
jgi:hypothetical protein